MASTPAKIDDGECLKPLYEALFPEKVGDNNSNDTFAPDELSGDMSYDLAATSQWAFESLMFGFIKDWVQAYPDKDVVLTGGCALH